MFLNSSVSSPFSLPTHATTTKGSRRGTQIPGIRSQVRGIVVSVSFLVASALICAKLWANLKSKKTEKPKHIFNKDHINDIEDTGRAGVIAILFSCSVLLSNSLCKKHTGDFNQQLPFPRRHTEFSDFHIAASSGSILNLYTCELRFPMCQKHCKLTMLKNKYCLHSGFIQQQ